MGLHNLFSSNAEIHYKSYLLSKAALFTCMTTILNIILPFIIAHRSRGFWLKFESFYEQPTVQFTYNYLLVAETNDPSKPIVCSDIAILDDSDIVNTERCAEFQVLEEDLKGDKRNDLLAFLFHLVLPPDKSIISAILILELDFKFKTVCPLHMQSLGVISKEFSAPASSFQFDGDLEVYQVAHLPCLWHNIDTTYNISLLNTIQYDNKNLVNSILREYHRREVTTQVRKLYSNVQYGQTAALNMEINLRVPEMKIRYIPSFLQEVKWAWPQYLSMAVIFHYLLNKLKRFVFHNRLLMVWEVTPWKKMH